MVAPVIQASFNAGEWSPNLNARVDLQKYRQGAALLENFFVDYRGGASSRQGTQYILQAYNSAMPVRLISFQASFTVGYILEFGEYYMRPFYNGAPILETGIAVTAGTNADPCVLDITQTWDVGDWIYITGVAGMTQLNSMYFRVNARTGTTVTLGDLNGNDIDSTAWGVFSGAGTASRVYTIDSPFAAADLALVKFAQNLSTLVMCHPNYNPQLLELVAADNWTFTTITFESSIAAPTGQAVATTLAAGSVNYAYVITAVNAAGEESAPSGLATLASRQDLRSTAGTNTISWSAVTDAVSYNVYKSDVSYAGAVPSGSQFGYIGNVTSLSLIDSNIAPDYSLSPPIPRNPFTGSGVANVTVTNGGSYTTTPTVTFDPPGGGITATGTVIMVAASLSVNFGGNGYLVGQSFSLGGGVTGVITSVDIGAGYRVNGVALLSPGSVIGPVQANPVAAVGGGGVNLFIDITWTVSSIFLTNPGTGYAGPPAITFSSGAAAATATIGAASAGNPSVPGFGQQRLWLANQQLAPQTFHASQTGAYYNLNVSNPILANDAIEASLSAGLLNEIKAIIAQQAGMIMLTNSAAWLVTGGQPGSAITPINITANPQSFIGASDVPPIVANFDVLFVQAKGSVVRNMSYNFYTNVYTGTDITVQSAHLFFGYTLQEWALAQEPFKLIWAVRDDGTLLSLTFLKEQEFIAWSHSVTQGEFRSVASVTEYRNGNFSDSVYVVVNRVVNGGNVQYIERFAERAFPQGRISSWSVDSGLTFTGTATDTFSGAQHLAGLTVTGVADGEVIEPFEMPADGTFTLPDEATTVTIGLPFTCKLKTLAIDTGDPTIQGKVKKIPSVTVRCADTLGIKIGVDFDHLVTMKDFVVGNVSSALTGQESQVVTDLVTGDGETILSPAYTTPGQYCIQQDLPYPVTVLGVIPNLEVGDTAK